MRIHQSSRAGSHRVYFRRENLFVNLESLNGNIARDLLNIRELAGHP
ncbi:MAG TPA: hypothetical protein VNZ25_02845 [Candidatus Angelobacter sp.]|nr:hypothetical protein [Candidatus Angelobacter sp.]